jgi:hypothetical protein
MGRVGSSRPVTRRLGMDQKKYLKPEFYHEGDQKKLLIQ